MKFVTLKLFIKILKCGYNNRENEKHTDIMK